MAALFADLPEAVAGHARARGALRVRPHPRPRLPPARRRAIDADRELPRSAARASTSATAGARRTRRRRSRRLDEELALIAHHRLSGFFLLHHEILELAREIALEVRGPDSPRHVLPPGRGRGSSVGSIVCYLTGLSHVDPVEARLSLGRFLNRGARGVPDIDLDFPRDIREQLILRGARAATAAPVGAHRRLRHLPRARGDPRARQGARTARRRHRPARARLRRLERGRRRRRDARSCRASPSGPATAASGRSRPWRTRSPACPATSRSTRAGWSSPTGRCRRLVPLQPAAMEGRTICQWDKDSCADAGFLKIDLLGLGMLSAGRGVRRPRSAGHGRAHRPLAHPARRPRGLRRDPGRRHRRRVPDRVAGADADAAAHAPQCLDDLVIEVALVRPGPIQGGAVHPYLAAAGGAAGRPGLPDPLRPPAARGGAARHARGDRLPGPGARRRPGARRLQRRPGGGAAPGDEPPPLARRRCEAQWQSFRDGAAGRGVRRARRAHRLRQDPRLLRLRLPQVARRRLRPARLPERLAAPALPGRLPLRAAERPADGLLPAGLAGARRRAPRRRGASPSTSPLGVGLPARGRRACGSASPT